jgi:hypothetical protein
MGGKKIGLRRVVFRTTTILHSVVGRTTVKRKDAGLLSPTNPSTAHNSLAVLGFVGNRDGIPGRDRTG